MSDNMKELILKHPTFESFLSAELAEELPEIATHGCDSGWPYLTYYTDTNALYDAFESEIEAKMAELASDYGNKAMFEMLPAGTDSMVTAKNWFVWAFVENFAQTFQPEEVEEAEDAV